MERMESTLTSVLNNHPPLPMDLQVGILHDVAVGLNFLHSQSKPIVHRDLSSNNILLTAHLVAKISDLGLAKYLQSSEIEAGSNTALGTQEYMPPEVLGTRPPQISPKTDIFSFGVILLQVATGKYPEVKGTINADTEIDRRKHHISILENNDPLYLLSIQCLQNNSCERPSAKALCDNLSQLCTPTESVICMRNELDMIKQSKEKLEHLYDAAQSQKNETESIIEALREHAKRLQEKLSEQESFYQTAHEQMKQKIAMLEDQLTAKQAKKGFIQETQNQYDDEIYHLRRDNEELKNVLDRVAADMSASNDKAYNYKSERNLARSQVKDLQAQLQLLSTQCEKYNMDQSRAYERIKTLEEENAYLKNENMQLNEVANGTARQGLNYGQFNEAFDVPINSGYLYQFSDIDDTKQDSHMHSTYLQSSQNLPSDCESHQSSTLYDHYVHRLGYSSQENQSQRNLYPSCSWEPAYSMSLSQTTNSQSEMVMNRGLRSLSQEHDQLNENTTLPSYGIPSYRSLPKELNEFRGANQLSMYRSSSVGSKAASQQTTHISSWKKVMTTRGELHVMCKAVHMMPELHLTEKVVVYRYYCDVNEYGTVRALNVPIENKPHVPYVGVELDRPGGNLDSDGVLNGVRYFKCKPQHAVFIHLKHVFKITDENFL